MRPITFNFAAASGSYLALTQSATSGTAFTLNPNNIDPTVISGKQIVLDNGQSQRSLSLTSTGDASAVTFTFVGLDQQRLVQTITITGPNNSTVYTASNFVFLNSITPNGSANVNITAGTGPNGSTRIFIPTDWGKDFGLGFAVYVSGAAVYTVQDTEDDPFVQTWSTLRFLNIDDTNLVTATSSQKSNYAFPARGVQVLKTDTGSGSISVVFHQEFV